MRRAARSRRACAKRAWGVGGVWPEQKAERPGRRATTRSTTTGVGGGGNVAANLAALGAKVEAFGVIGSDEAGRALQKCLREASMGDRGVLAEAKRVTTVKTRIIAKHHQVVRVDRERREPPQSET